MLGGGGNEVDWKWSHVENSGYLLQFESFSLWKVGFPEGAVVKNSPANAGNAWDVGSIPELGRSPGGGSGNPL